MTPIYALRIPHGTMRTVMLNVDAAACVDWDAAGHRLVGSYQQLLERRSADLTVINIPCVKLKYN